MLDPNQKCPVCGSLFSIPEKYLEPIQESLQKLQESAPEGSTVGASVLCPQCAMKTKRNEMTNEDRAGSPGPFGRPPNAMLDALEMAHSGLTASVAFLKADAITSTPEEILDEFAEPLAKQIGNILGDPDRGDPRPNNAQVRSALIVLLEAVLSELRDLNWPDYE